MTSCAQRHTGKRSIQIMKLTVTITGQTPDRWREALAELSDDLSMTAGENGVEIRCHRGEGIEIGRAHV